MDDRGTSAKPGSDGPDDHKVVLDLLNSEAWQKRLEAARVERERVLAERGRKAVVVPNPFGTGKPPRADRLPPLEPAAQMTEREAALRPLFTAKSRAEIERVASDPAPSLAGTPPAGAPVVAPAPAPEVGTAPMPTRIDAAPGAKTSFPPARTSVRVALGFAVGVIAGLGAGVLPWLLRSGDGEIPVAAPPGPVTAPAPQGTAPRTEEDAGALPLAPTEAPRTQPPSAPPVDAAGGGETGLADLGGTGTAPAGRAAPDVAPSGILNITSISAQTRPPGPDAPMAIDAAFVALAPPSAPNVAGFAATRTEARMPVASATRLPQGAGSPGSRTSISTPVAMTVERALAVASQPAPLPGVAAAAPLQPLPDLEVFASFSGTIEPQIGGILPGMTSVPVRPVAPGLNDLTPAAIAPPPAPEAEANAAALVIAAGHTVRVMAPTRVTEQRVTEATKAAADDGFALGDPVRVPFKITADHVRFYHAPDRAAAEMLAAGFGGDARDFTGSGNGTPRGTIELWLQGEAQDEPVAAKPKVKKKPATAAAPKPAVPQENPQVRALRDKIIRQLQNGDHT